MKYIVSKDGKISCVTTVPYGKETVQALKKAGYKIKEVQDSEAK